MKTIKLLSFILLISLSACIKKPVDKQPEYFNLIIALKDYKNAVSESYHLARSWVFIEKIGDTPDKLKFKEFTDTGMVKLFTGITNYSNLLNDDEKNILTNIKGTAESLRWNFQYIISSLNSYESYDDPMIIFSNYPIVQTGGDIDLLVSDIITKLDLLIDAKMLEYDEMVNGD